ncbi:uncharacterized protein ColSpa_09380 [Colletotrichum spaethianum]|uniref:Uncharacterized protein n=1 Tax=Colletotrichum spaethianum TaxID=700344 RepID=A0AA37UJ61_9PEZI|nr:uncharacterized protein ColSpa_09380 [Colletotrichum spaethianum]GKT49199.1 hypothetical protein ColSpa_09380 [Colletotrichum spaethianum]
MEPLAASNSARDGTATLDLVKDGPDLLSAGDEDMGRHNQLRVGGNCDEVRCMIVDIPRP